MTGVHVNIVDPVTGEVVDRCHGPTATRACPRAGSDGVVACAGRRIAPLNGDREYWMRWVASTSQHCVLAWTAHPGKQMSQLANDYERAVFCWKRAEACRDEWFTGRMAEIAFVRAQAVAGDARFKNMAAHELENTARWRWSHSAHAKILASQEERFTQRAKMYLSFARADGNDHAAGPG